MGLVLALLSTMSMTVLPVAPSFAAASAPVSTEQKLTNYAKSGDLAVLSRDWGAAARGVASGAA